MPKSKKNSKTKDSVKTNGEQAAKTETQFLVRAIRVTPQILEAAKRAKAEKGISFYRLGLEAISERLAKEGYLKETVKEG
mgnify:CR=1 FL=1